MVSHVIYFLVIIFSIHSEVFSTDTLSSCRKCKSGFYVNKLCNKDNELFHDTVCAPCSSGHFMPLDDNLKPECNVCTVCPSGTYISVPCSTIIDTKCESCDIKTDSESYRSLCQNVKQTDLSISGEGLTLDETGSGTDEPLTVLSESKNVSVINEELNVEDDGSGDTILDIPSSNEIVLDNITVVEPTSTTNKSVSSNITVEKEDEFLPVPVTESPTTPSIQGTPSTSTTTSTVSTSGVPTTPVTTTQSTTVARELDLGLGIDIKDDGENEDNNPEDVVIHLVDKTTKKDNYDSPSRSAVADRKTAMTNDSDKVSIGILIAVAIIAALVFFVIGFIVSKYCRRRRQTMKMMKSPNGHHNGSAPVIDTSRPIYTPNGIYDEIGKEANGTCSTPKLDEIVPVHAENVYAVPNKKKKPEDEIKYIDETTDDENENREGDRLLEKTEDEVTPPPPRDESEQNTNPPEENTDEDSPMLSEIQSEMENGKCPEETDSLMGKS